MSLSNFLDKLPPVSTESFHIDNASEWVFNYVAKNNAKDPGVKQASYNSFECDLEKLTPESLIANVPFPLLYRIRNMNNNSEKFVFSDLQHNYLAFNFEYKENECTYVIHTIDEVFIKKFEDFLKGSVVSKASKNNVYVISSSRSGLSLHSMGTLDTKLEETNYDPSVIEGYNYILEEFQKKDPYGRLAIVNGPPGTGKSYMLRSLLSTIKNSLIILLPAKMVGDIDSPSIIKLLSEERYYGDLEDLGREKIKNMPIVFVLEDADACLVPRDDGNMSTISSFLNYSDGIFGSMLDMRIIATTNADRIQFDAALTRPGRLCRHVRVGLLSPEQAGVVYTRLTGKQKVYTEETSLATVYGDAYNKKPEKQKKVKNLGFSA